MKSVIHKDADVESVDANGLLVLLDEIIIVGLEYEGDGDIVVTTCMEFFDSNDDLDTVQTRHKLIDLFKTRAVENMYPHELRKGIRILVWQLVKLFFKSRGMK